MRSFSGPFCTSAVKAEFAPGALRLAGARLYPKLVRSKAHFVEPMLLLRKEQLPDDPNWLLELKLDGYRALAFKTGGRVHLRSRNDNDFNGHYPGIVQALESMPDETVIDGEVVALDPDGRPSFNALQNYGGTGTPINYYVFDLLIRVLSVRVRSRPWT